MRGNDVRLREQQQIGTAQEQISKYAEALQAHPEWDEKAQEVSEFAQGTRDLAVKNPEKWIRAVEAITGISRNWRDDEATGTATANAERGQQHQRIAKKPLANVARPTNGNRVAVVPAGSTDMSPSDAFEHNWNRVMRH